MITTLKQMIKLILFYLTDIFFKKRRITYNTLLLIRLDAIGDYILFRNFIEILKKEYKNYHITLVGNSAWKSLSEKFDSNFIDKYIWVDTKKFERNPFYRYKKLNEINKEGYEIVINSTYSRTFFKDDAIVKVLNSNKKIGSSGDLTNIAKWQKNISDKYYDLLVPSENKVIFEFYRNKSFFGYLFNKRFEIKKPFIKLPNKKLSFNLPNKYAILFIGASANFRKWDISNYVKIGRYIKNKFNLDIVLCGAPIDKEDAKKFKKLADYKYIDMVGKTSLLDLLYIIKDAKLILSNETSTPHFAVALDIKNIFVISNGNHFGRFTPYPKDIWQHYYPIYPFDFERQIDNYNKLVNSYGYGSKLDINNIKVTDVKEKLNKYYKKEQ